MCMYGGGVLVPVFFWWCGGVFVLVFLGWCLVVVFLWCCSCCCVCVVVLLWWCFCGGVFVLVFLGWCFCGVVAVVWLRWCLEWWWWWCSCGGVQSTAPVLQNTTPYYKVQLRTPKYYSSTTPILLCTTKYYSSTTPYYRALLRPLKRCQNDVLPVLLRTTPVLQKLPKRAFRARLPQLFKEQASKTSISCDASYNFHRTTFQNERFARCFRQFSQKKLPKGFSCEASSKFHRRSFQNERFVRGFLQISQNHASKTSVSHDASDNFARKSFQNDRFVRGFFQISQNKLFQNERFARCFRQFSRKICVSLQFRAIDTPLPARGFIRQKQNVLRTTTPCIPKCDNVRFATAPCTKMYESIHREPTRFAHTKM